MEEKETRHPCQYISRREFMKMTSKAAAAMAFGLGAIRSERITVPDTVRWGRRPRVVRTYDANATWWDYSSNYYFDFVDQQSVNRLVLRGARELMGTASDTKAWSRLLGGGTHKRAIVAIKINCNNYSNQSNVIDATAPTINAVLRGLCGILGIPPGNIYVYDCTRPIYQWRIRDRVNWNVNFVQSGDSLAQPDYNAPIEFRGIGDQYCPYVLTQANHLINLNLFKDHSLVLSTMGFKNHFGTSRPGPWYLHTPIQTNLSDLNATPHIRDKTRLTVADALWGVYTGGPGGWPQQWHTFPGGPTPNSIFLGRDPVAVESVQVDYLIQEQEYHGISLLSHEYLHDAMEYHRLGVHEHWDENHQYHIIDYVEIDLTRTSPAKVTARRPDSSPAASPMNEASERARGVSIDQPVQSPKIT